MAKLTITRPNGDTEYAELTTNKSLVGDNYLTVEKSGTTYYAKLASNISTHMYVIKPYSSTKLYVQKKADKKKYKIRIDQDYPNQQEVNVTINGHYYCYDGVEEFEEGTEWRAWVYNRDGDYDNGHIVGDTSGILHSDIHVWASSPTKKYKPTPKKKYKIRIIQKRTRFQIVVVTINGTRYDTDGEWEFEEGTSWSAYTKLTEDGERYGFEEGHIIGDTSGTLHSDIVIEATPPTEVDVDPHRPDDDDDDPHHEDKQ